VSVQWLGYVLGYVLDNQRIWVRSPYQKRYVPFGTEPQIIM